MKTIVALLAFAACASAGIAPAAYLAAPVAYAAPVATLVKSADPIHVVNPPIAVSKAEYNEASLLEQVLAPSPGIKTTIAVASGPVVKSFASPTYAVAAAPVVKAIAAPTYTIAAAPLVAKTVVAAAPVAFGVAHEEVHHFSHDYLL